MSELKDVLHNPAEAGSHNPTQVAEAGSRRSIGLGSTASLPLTRLRGRIEPWLTTAVLVWLAGVLALSLNLLRGWLSVRRLRHRALSASAEWTARVASVAHRMRLTRPVMVLESALIEVPAVMGWLRPALLLPASALTGLAPAQIDAILAHELAHVRRHDYLVNLLQSAVETLLFFHPAVWWVSHRIRVEREHCCDDVAVEICGDRLTYARALVSLEESRVATPGLALAATDGSLLTRLRRVLEVPPRKTRSDGWLVSCLALAIVLLGLTGGRAISAPAVPHMVASLPDGLPAIVPLSWDQAPVPGVTTPPPAAASTNQATIRGRVTVAGSSQVVRGAQIVIGPVPRQPPKVQVVYTDNEGRYEFRNLEAGRYTMSARKDGFIEMSYGESRPQQGEKVLQLTAGSSLSDLNFALPKGGVITGVVVDQFGEPVARASVGAREIIHGSRVGLRATAALGPGAFTNDIGEFRLFGIAPGSYVVFASKNAAFNTVPGTLTNNFSAYTRVYAPGTATLSEARVITLETGRAVSGVTVAFGSPRQGRTISGVAIGPDGRPMSGPTRVNIYQPGAVPPAAGGSGTLPANGTFSIPGIFPGTYELRAVLSNAAAVGTVTVADEDVTGVTLRPVRMPLVRGQVILEPQAKSQLPLSAVRVGMVSTDPSNSPGWQPAAVTINEDLAFEMRGLPGGWLVTPTLPPGWSVKAVRFRGGDITDSGLNLREGEDVSDLEIELTNRPAQVAGTVRGERGEAVDDYTALVFARDPQKRSLSARYFAMARGDQAGKFAVTALPPGEYYAIAVPYVNVNEAQNPDLLDRLSRDATPFSLQEGESRTLELRLRQ